MPKSPEAKLMSPPGRKIRYLRISATDLCNLRCIYCMPPEGVPLLPHDEILTFEETALIARRAAGLGIEHLRLTGGEPLVRKDIAKLVRMLASIPGIRDLSLTTNGTLLSGMARDLKAAGVKRITISIDTLDEEKYARITRGGKLTDALSGLASAKAAGFENIKVNCVAMRGINDDEISSFVHFADKEDIEVRFIELMPVGNRGLADEGLFFPAWEIRKRLEKAGRLIPVNSSKRGGPASPTGGPAVGYFLEGRRGKIGLITAVSEPFCSRCNRLRLTAEGKLRSCLLAGGEVDLLPILREKGDPALLDAAFFEAARAKPQCHKYSGEVLMSRIGG